MKHTLRKFRGIRFSVGSAIVNIRWKVSRSVCGSDRKCGYRPGLLSLKKLAVGSNLELETHLAVHDRLQLTQDRLEVATQTVRLASQASIVGLQLSLAVLLGASQGVDFTSQLRILHQHHHRSHQHHQPV